MTDPEVLKKEREDWSALLESDGWARLMGFVKLQWGANAYQKKVEAALASDDISAVKVATQVRKELELLMEHPAARMKELAHAMEPVVQTPSRRGTL